ncbi:MAG: SDR family NAD(P)-dependent oxidoreductase, partial [Reyranellaceae bacterium]
MLLQGKACIVTGAASGIGAASAALFAEQGATVLAVDRPGTSLAQAHAGSNAVRVLEQDITADDAPAAIVAAANAQLGGIDVLFNNAGVSTNALAE